jgi:transposase-like protein
VPKRRNFSDQFKAAVELEALRGDKTVLEIAAKRQLHPTQVSTWKRQAIEGMAGVFSDKVKKAGNKDGEIKDLHARIGQLAVENDFFVTRAKAVGPLKRREMILKENTKLRLTRQCKLLKISRSSIYYTPVGQNAETLKLMHEIDRVFTKYPFFGSRQIAAYLPRFGFSVGRHLVRRLMGIMGLQAVYKGQTLARSTHSTGIYPYLLRKLAITRANQVWCSDITYIPVKRGFDDGEGL